MLEDISITLEDEHVKQLLNLPVEMFGTVSKLLEVFPNINTDDMHEILKSPHVRKELFEIVKKEDVLRMDVTLPKPHRLYIPRSISNRLLLDPIVFKLECTDVFVFKGIDRSDLVKLASPHATRSSTTQRSIVTCRHIYLDNVEDWDDMTLVCKTPIHLVFKEDQQYVLQCTTKVTDILRRHCKPQSRSEDAYISEEDFIIKFFCNRDNKVVLLCDVPGMGKSWLMESLARLLKKKSSNVHIFLIQLPSFSTYLAKFDKLKKQKDALKLVFEFQFSSKLAQSLLEKQG